MRILAFILAAVALSACGGRRIDTLPPPTPARLGAVERGVASWYGHPYHGRRTSNGEVYDMNLLTAAHPSLPFDTVVRVENLDSGQSVDVRINDRGPFVHGRIIDLSREAASQIGMIGNGTARVAATIVGTPEMTRGGGAFVSAEVQQHSQPGALDPCSAQAYFGVQVGSFESLENAERMRGKMADRYGSAVILEAASPDGTLYRVLVGQASKTSEVQRWLAKLRQDNFDAFIQRSDAGRTLNCT